MENSKPITIFAVEDEKIWAQYIKMSLNNENYKVTVFTTGEEMISSWEEDPDIIILDYNIKPGMAVYMNGEKILRFIRRINKSLPVIALTAEKDFSIATGMLRLGAVDFIVKNIQDIKNLQDTVSQIIEARSLREEITRNKMQIRKYRQHFLVIILTIALAAMTILWLSS